jgi:hypothetical protein
LCATLCRALRRRNDLHCRNLGGLPRKENWDDYLENAKMLRPELEQVDGGVVM